MQAMLCCPMSCIRWTRDLIPCLPTCQIYSPFDKNGKITATTSGYEGYQLSKNEGDTENLLWSIINGADRELFLPVAGESGKYYCAVRRTDDIGLICMKVSNQSVQTLINRLDLAGMFQNMSFDGSERLILAYYMSIMLR